LGVIGGALGRYAENEPFWGGIGIYEPHKEMGIKEKKRGPNA
jgi:hypothetical protein